MAVSAVEVADLVKAYGDNVAVNGVTLSAAAGAITAILGPNGAGKTSTVEICEGLRRKDAGTVSVLGLPPGARELRSRVGVMPQKPGSYPGARCGEMLRLIASYYADPLDPGMLLERLGLETAARTPYRRLSGGQQQRLSLAMALVGRPELVFLDEPTAGLDVQARHLTWDLVRELRSTGVTVVLTTHAMDEASALADHVVVIDHGKVLASGSVDTLTKGDAAGQIRFRADAALPLDGLRSRLPAGSTAVETEPGRYLVEATVDPQVLALVTAWAADEGALATDLQVERRSLEDVFLDLTGRAPRA
jgi:ABC-2 type transport system ATP-binding protein